MRIYLCHWCEKGEHAKCEGYHAVRPGEYGGSKCVCLCSDRDRLSAVREFELNVKDINELLEHEKRFSRLLP